VNWYNVARSQVANIAEKVSELIPLVSRYLVSFSPFTRAQVKSHIPRFNPITTNAFSAASRGFIVASASGFDRPERGMLGSWGNQL